MSSCSIYWNKNDAPYFHAYFQLKLSCQPYENKDSICFIFLDTIIIGTQENNTMGTLSRDRLFLCKLE
jgi:hypothetical protein